MARGDDHTELTRDALYAQVWAEPMMKLARQYGLSDRGLAKICDRLGIPTPGRGYWAKVQNGQTPVQPKLPRLKPGQQGKVILNKRGHIRDDSPEQQVVAAQVAHEQESEHQIVVPEALDYPHPLVAKTAKSLDSAKANDYGIARPRARQCLDVRVAKDSIERASRIMDALIRALEARGIELTFSEEGEYGSRLVVDGEALGFRLEEKTRRDPYQPTPAEQKKLKEDPYYRWRLPNDKFIPTGHLSLQLNTGYGSGLRSTWADGKQQRIEYCLNKFIATAYQAAAHQKADRLERERQHRVWEEQERRRVILKEQIKLEQARLDRLAEQAKAWQESQQLRAYIRAVRGAGYYPRQNITGGIGIDDWCAWALDQANRLDPTTTSPPSVLDYKDKCHWY